MCPDKAEPCEKKPEGEFLLPVWVLHSGLLGQEAPGHTERSVGQEPLVLRAWVTPVAALCIVMAKNQNVFNPT